MNGLSLCLRIFPFILRQAQDERKIYRSHAPRGNASCNAPALRNATLERHRRHSHAERGNDVSKSLTQLPKQSLKLRFFRHNIGAQTELTAGPLQILQGLSHFEIAVARQIIAIKAQAQFKWDQSDSGI